MPFLSPPTCSVRHLYISPSVQRDCQLMSVLKALTRSATYVSLQHALSVILHFPICAEGRSPDDSPIGLDKVCHVRFPPTCSVRHLYICPSVQRDGQLRTVLKALTKSPIAKEVKDLLTLLEQHDAQSTCYASGSNKISQRWTRGRAFFALGCLFGVRIRFPVKERY